MGDPRFLIRRGAYTVFCQQFLQKHEKKMSLGFIDGAPRATLDLPMKYLPFYKACHLFAGRSHVCVPAHPSLDFSKTRHRLSQMDEVIIQDLPTLYVSSKTSHFSLC